MEVAAAWAEVRVGVRKRDNIKSIYMVLEVAVALAEARVGVKGVITRGAYPWVWMRVGLEYGGFERRWFEKWLVLLVPELAYSVCSRIGLLCSL